MIAPALALGGAAGTVDGVSRDQQPALTHWKSTASVTKGVQQLEALGFIATSIGDRRTRVFRRREDWGQT